jgi:hypothetical protein
MKIKIVLHSFEALSFNVLRGCGCEIRQIRIVPARVEYSGKSNRRSTL